MSTAHHYIREDNTVVEVCTTDIDDGDFHVNSDSVELTERRAAIMAGPWAVAMQVHGARVVEADPVTTPEADALITSTVGQPIGVQGADCAPLAFITDRGPIAVAHAGWRGLASGVIGETVDRLHQGGGQVQCVVVGPVIGPECYEFGAEDLDLVAALLGDDVRSITSTRSPALDLRAAITGACASSGVVDVRFIAGCTGCEDAGFSHRARGDRERHALVARILPRGTS